MEITGLVYTEKLLIGLVAVCRSVSMELGSSQSTEELAVLIVLKPVVGVK